MKLTKNATVCEVCPDPVRKTTGVLQVGRKLSGVPRLIHDRSRCRQRWAAEKDRIMPKWAENRPAASALPVAAAQAQVAPPPEFTRQAPAPTPPPVATTASGPTVAFTLAEEGKKRHRWKFSQATDQAIEDYFSKRPWKVGAAGKLYAIIQETRPELLVDETGKAITEPAFSSQVTKLLRNVSSALLEVNRNGLMVSEAPAAPASEPAPSYPNLAHAVEAAGRIHQGVMALVLVNDVETLDALEGILEKRN